MKHSFTGLGARKVSSQKSEKWHKLLETLKNLINTSFKVTIPEKKSSEKNEGQ